MDDKKYCSYCKYSNFDTGYFPPRFTCTLYKERMLTTAIERARRAAERNPLSFYDAKDRLVTPEIWWVE